MDKRVWDLWQVVRQERPLVQCITNYVSMASPVVLSAGSGCTEHEPEALRCWQDIMANSLLAAGCSPAMVHATAEVEDFSRIASALLVRMLVALRFMSAWPQLFYPPPCR